MRRFISPEIALWLKSRRSKSAGKPSIVRILLCDKSRVRREVHSSKPLIDFRLFRFNFSTSRVEGRDPSMAEIVLKERSRCISFGNCSSWELRSTDTML